MTRSTSASRSGVRVDLLAASLLGVVDDAGGLDALLVLEVVQVVEQLEEGGALAALALLDLVDGPVVGEVQAEQAVDEDVLAALVRVALLVERSGPGRRSRRPTPPETCSCSMPCANHQSLRGQRT